MSVITVLGKLGLEYQEFEVTLSYKVFKVGLLYAIRSCLKKKKT